VHGSPGTALTRHDFCLSRKAEAGARNVADPKVIGPRRRLGTAPAPAAPLKSQSKTLSRLRAENRHQSDRLHQQGVELRQQGAAIQRLRKQVEGGG
jgi:hypothetical protein